MLLNYETFLKIVDHLLLSVFTLFGPWSLTSVNFDVVHEVYSWSF